MLTSNLFCCLVGYNVQVRVKDEEGNLVDKWTPCSPGDPSAVEKTWTDIGEKELQEPPLGVSHSNINTHFFSACFHLSSLVFES